MINTIRTLIRKAELGLALEISYEVFYNSNSHHGAITNISSEYNRLQKEIGSGIVRGDDIRLSMNQLGNRLLNTLETAQSDKGELSRIEQERNKGRYEEWIEYYNLYEIPGKKNISTGNITAGGSVVIGDNNTAISGVNYGSVIQINNGGGDNIGGSVVIDQNGKRPIPEPDMYSNHPSMNVHTVSTTTVTVELSQVLRVAPEPNKLLIKEIFQVMMDYFMTKMEFGIIFPHLAKEAEEVYNYLGLMAVVVAEANNLNHIDEVREALPQIRKDITKLYEKAAKELKTAKNDETSLVISSLAADLPTLEDFKKAYGHLKQMKKEHLVEEITELPTNPTLVRMKKNSYVLAAKS